MKQRVVWWSAELVTELMKTGIAPGVVVKQGLPADAELVRIIPDHSLSMEAHPPRVGLVYHSNEFSDTPEGSLIPELQIIFTREAS